MVQWRDYLFADRPPVPRETCRFFERGNCTWGDRCRFVHPGVNDRGNAVFDSCINFITFKLEWQ